MENLLVVDTMYMKIYPILSNNLNKCVRLLFYDKTTHCHI
jgi:hypothetical protein